MLSSAFQGLGNVCPKFGISTLPIMQIVFPDSLGEVPEAIAYKCFKVNWFDFHWVKKDENAISLGSGCVRSNLDERHIGGRGGGGTSQLLFLASHRHCLGIGSQFDNAANLFILLFIMKLYHVHLAPDFLPCLHSMITLSYNIRSLMIDEMSQSKLVNHWKVRNFPSGDNCRQIRIQDTLGGQWWLSIFTGRI